MREYNKLIVANKEEIEALQFGENPADVVLEEAVEIEETGHIE